MPQATIGKTTISIPVKDSPCPSWQTYFDQLKKLVGTDNARMLWLVTWQENGDSACLSDARFNKWLKQNKIDVSSQASRALADLGQIGFNFLGLGKNMTRVLSVGTPLLLGGVLLVVMIVLYNTAKKADATDVAALMPQGRALAALKMASKR